MRPGQALMMIGSVTSGMVGWCCLLLVVVVVLFVAWLVGAVCYFWHVVVVVGWCCLFVICCNCSCLFVVGWCCLLFVVCLFIVVGWCCLLLLKFVGAVCCCL